MTSAAVSAGAKHPGPSLTRRVSRLPTGTVNGAMRVVPWLAAEGPLAYTPESPPPKDYFFQYGWILPGVLRPDSRGLAPSSRMCRTSAFSSSHACACTLRSASSLNVRPTRKFRSTYQKSRSNFPERSA